jgi:integrase
VTARRATRERPDTGQNPTLTHLVGHRHHTNEEDAMTNRIDANQFAAYLATLPRADSTIRNYRALYVRWVDWALTHQRDPWQPDPLAVRAWSAQLHGSREVLAQARATIGHLCDALAVHDVSTAIVLPRKPRRGPRPLHPAARDQLTTVAWESGTAGTAVLVLLGTAMRRSEAAGLAWDGIDFDEGTVTFWRPKTRDWHTVDLHPLLAARLAERADSGEQWVFPGRHGGHVPAARINDWVTQVATAAGVAVTPHRLRHTALTDAYNATGDFRAVQDLAGHVNASQTSLYTQTSRDRGRAAVAAIPLRSRRDDAA